MAVSGGHLAEPCFELVIAHISRTTHSSWMKFGMYIDIDKAYQYSKYKPH